MGCTRTVIAETEPAPAPAPVVDSTETVIRFLAGTEDVQQLDLFIYSASGTRELEQHIQYSDLPDRLIIRTPTGEKILVGIANSPLRFNLNALARFDAMEQLRYQFADDNPDRPILGGSVTTQENSGTISLQPLLCKVRLVKVSNTMDGYELLEAPRVRLLDLPDAAEILKQCEFRPAELLDSGPWHDLPYDVGYFPQEPGITLWCYPNDTPETVLGVPRPTLEFECTIRGETYSFEVPLPPLSRGCAKEVELIVDGPGSYRYKVK